MPIGWPAVRLIKLGQRKRRAQLKDPCFLLLGEGDCREQCILGRRRIRRIALEQNLAAQAMQESVAPVFSCLTCEGQRFLDPDQGSLCVALSFDLGKQTLVERHEQSVSLVGVRRQRQSKLRRAGLAAVQASACPGGLQRSQGCKLRNRVLLAEFDDSFSVAPGSSSITANYLEVGLVDISGDQGRYMTGFDR